MRVLLPLLAFVGSAAAQIGSILSGAQASGYILLRDKTTGQEAVMPKLCTFYPDSGRCYYIPKDYTMLVRYFYNTTTDACQPFWYTQCAGNQNRFASATHCKSYCSPKYVTPPQSSGSLNSDPSADSGVERNGVDEMPEPPPFRGGLTPPAPGPVPGLPRVCEMRKDAGFACSSGPGSGEQRWYWSGERFACLAFRFEGCGGSLNNFLTQSECLAKCRPLDGPVCTLGGPPLRIDLPQPPRDCEQMKCPPTHVCRMGAFFPACCPKEFEEEEVCSDGSRPYSPPQAYFWMGDSCGELQCPAAFRCQMGRKLAKCCQAAANAVKPPRLSLSTAKRQTELSPAEPSSVSRKSPPRINPDCLAFKDGGPCRESIPRWFLDFNSLTCKSFIFGGCDGNSNNFSSRRDCEESCLGS